MLTFLENRILDITTHNNIEQIVIIAVNIVIFIVVFDALRMLKVILTGQYLSVRSSPLSTRGAKERLERHIQVPKKKILILGDSTAVGTGARDKKASLAGRFAHDFPESDIVNRGINGAITRDVIKQLDNVENETFDLVVISVGGNDIWHFSRLGKLRRDLEQILKKAKQMSNQRVILLLYNNIGDAPAFSFLTRGLLRRRGKKVHEVFQQASTEEGVPCIELFATKKENPFMDPHKQKTLFAADGIHPSGEGYRYWYNRMWSEMVRQGYRYR